MRSLQIDDPEQVGDYALVARLGRGAMGTVYLGRSLGGRPVAVKIARAGLAADPEFRARFRQEIAMARAVGGFWTAAVVGADPDAHLPWLATEYVPGPTLHEAVSAHGPLPEPVLRRLLAGLAEALSAIHAAGLVHRDLKPSNVLLAADGPRVIDFGIAKAIQAAPLTSTGLVVGTPGYLSPEQIAGEPVGPPSDIFALGAALVFAAAGRGPYGEGEPTALLYRALHAGPDLGGVPDALRPAVSRCLNARPQARPTPAELLVEAGPFDTGSWLPAAVRTLVEDRRTELNAPVHRPPTRVFTEFAEPRARVSAPPRSATPPPPAAPPHSATPVRPATPPRQAPAPARVPAQRPRPAAPEPAGRTVFRTSRVMMLFWAVAAGFGVAAGAAVADYATQHGRSDLAAGALVVIVLLGLSGVRSLARFAVAKRRRVEVSEHGLAVRTADATRVLTWAEIELVRVADKRGKPWLVVWPSAAADSGASLGARHSRKHGGYRVYPVAHTSGSRRQAHELVELRAALARYGGKAYDPTD
ncbi:serine/threonine-protein kinase [Actinokineospora sp. NBRC 105648]|uniref:serine/threonine-protein kinase n=1 Tax=Actinokineospora sp. NBRC 105648 TaxID=3032206 RepID=UPI0024A53421|nr:serine/threonine-protein kinase [Actinokineospora sp. NBRC 105648]GLZ43187.1 hypothetical protein Acsp05_68110 [Actinokineospora sp. NBRC 105648]